MSLGGFLENKFISYIQDYQEQLDPNLPRLERVKWDIDAIIAFSQSRDPVLKRKPMRNLKKACEMAIIASKSCDDEPMEEDEEGDNHMNQRMVDSYKRQRKKPKNESTTQTLSDMAGMDEILNDVMQLIGLPLKHPEIYMHLGIEPPRGILLHGPPGTGKTMLAHAIAGELKVPFINISAPSVVSGMSGESEKKLREVFDEAKNAAPSILFIDEIDAITPKRENAQREMERRIVAQLLTCLDSLSPQHNNGKTVMVIAATNRPDSLDPALRRAGRFDREIPIGVPDEKARAKILEKMCEKLLLDETIDLVHLSKLTPGFVGADLCALTSEAGLNAIRRIFDHFAQGKVGSFLEREQLNEAELHGISIGLKDFEEALKVVQPSCKREGFATIPDVTWEDVGALSTVRDEIRMALIEPILHPDRFMQVGISSPMGILLYGPPGCGKTLLAKAVANESHCNFISVKGPELLNKYVGESERAIRTVFSRAQASSPCIIFFDELDALCPTRSKDSDTQSSRLVNTLLTELDGMQSRKKVYIIAATNRPDMIDPAMLRPGRLDKCLYVDLPSAQERIEILKTITKRTPLDNVDLEMVANHTKCQGFTGADLAALVREAAVASLRVYNDPPRVTYDNFETAFKKISPSVSTQHMKRYELLKVRFSASI